MTNARKRQRIELLPVNNVNGSTELRLLTHLSQELLVMLLKHAVSIEFPPFPKMVGRLRQVNKNLRDKLTNIMQGHDEFGFWSYVFSHAFIDQYHGMLNANMDTREPTFWYRQYRNHILYRYSRHEKWGLQQEYLHHVRYNNEYILRARMSEREIYHHLTSPLNKIYPSLDLIFTASQYNRKNLLKLFYATVKKEIQNETSQHKQYRLGYFAVRCGQIEEVESNLLFVAENNDHRHRQEHLNILLQDAIHYGHVDIVKLLKSRLPQPRFNLTDAVTTSANHCPELVTALLPATNQEEVHPITCPLLKASTLIGHWEVVESLAPRPTNNKTYHAWKASWLTAYAEDILKIAAEKGHSTKCDEVLNLHEQQPVSNKTLESALIKALSNGHLAIAEKIANHLTETPNKAELMSAIRAVIIADDVAMLRFIHRRFPASVEYEITENIHVCLNQLLFAAYQASRTVTEYLITEQHFVIDQQKQRGNNQGFTALHYATRNEDILLVRLLLKLGANTNIRDCHGETPLHLAVRENSVMIARYLLENNAEVNCTNRLKETPLDLGIRSQKCSLTLNEALLAHNASGTLVLHTAITAHLRPDGHKYHLLERLLTTKRFDPNELNEYKLTPLEVAANSTRSFSKQFSIIGLLVNNGANPLYAIANAIKQQHICCAKTIVTLINLTHANPQERLPGELLPVMDKCDLLVATEIANNLLVANTERSNSNEEQLQHAYFFAVLAGDRSLITNLLDLNDISVNTIRLDGANALVIAAAYGHYSIVKLLIEKYHANVQQAIDYVDTHEQWASGQKILSYWLIRVNNIHQSTKQQILTLLHAESTTRLLQSAIQPYGTLFHSHYLAELANINDNDISAIHAWLQKYRYLIPSHLEEFINENILSNLITSLPTRHSAFFTMPSDDTTGNDMPELNESDVLEWINTL